MPRGRFCRTFRPLGAAGARRRSDGPRIPSRRGRRGDAAAAEAAPRGPFGSVGREKRSWVARLGRQRVGLLESRFCRFVGKGVLVVREEVGRVISPIVMFAFVSACSAGTPAPAEPAGSAAQAASQPGGITEEAFGEVDGRAVSLYTLRNARGLLLKATNYGTIVTELHVPDRDGKLADIVLGYESLQGYLAATPYFGATAGRVANRIANAQFELDGRTFTLPANDGPHTLHGGTRGWDKVVWEAEPEETPEGPSVVFTYVSADGEQGFPGAVTATVRYTLTHDDSFDVTLQATTDEPTIVNMVHHGYWNLAGFDSGTVLDQELMLSASQYTPVAPVENAAPVPDGTVAPVAGTPFDFTASKRIGKDLAAAGGDPVGFDHNWVVDGEPASMRLVARARDPKSGRVMTLEGDAPGVQFYTGNFLDGSITGKGARYVQHSGFCLETQRFPNAINVPGWRSQVLLAPGQSFRNRMIHRFTAE